MKSYSPNQLRCQQAGFSLIEVTIAMGIASVCMVTLLGLIPLGITNNQASSEQTAATSIAADISAQLRNLSTQLSILPRPTTNPASPYGLKIPTATFPEPPLQQVLYFKENGVLVSNTINLKPAATDHPRYRLTVIYTPPPNTTPQAATYARILVSWPAVTDPDPAIDVTKTALKTKTFVEIMTTLNCN